MHARAWQRRCPTTAVRAAGPASNLPNLPNLPNFLNVWGLRRSTDAAGGSLRIMPELGVPIVRAPTREGSSSPAIRHRASPALTRYPESDCRW